MRTASIVFSSVVLSLGLAVGCSATQRVKTETILAQALVSDQQSEQIGERIHAELVSQGVRYVGDREVVAYVESVAGGIFELAHRDRSGVAYHVHVIDDPKTVNAFATPGGHIYVYSGLLLTAANEAELAGVLAHETGHLAGRHVERAMVDAYGVQALAALALGQNPSLAKRMATGLVGTGILRAHTRSEETEADERGVSTISSLNYDPQAMITFLQKLQATESRTPAALAWLRTHPLTEKRISNLTAYIRAHGLGGSVVGQGRHQAIRQKLA